MDDGEDGGMVGPPKPQVSAVKAVEASGYGFALMPGEGEAMASYVTVVAGHATAAVAPTRPQPPQKRSATGNPST